MGNNLISNSHITYINLSYSLDRKEKMQNELKRVGLTDFHRFNALTNNDCPNFLRPKLSRMFTNGVGSVGCTMSHLTILNNCLQEGKHAFVLEDDLVLATDTLKRLDVLDAFTQSNEWDILFLGGTYHVNPAVWHSTIFPHKEMYNCNYGLGRDAERTQHERIIRTYGCWCTYAYIVNVKSIQKVLDLTNEYIENTFALDQCWIKIQPQLNCFAYLPGIAKQYDDISIVQGTMHNFSNFSSLGGYWWQDLEEQFNPANFNWAEASKQTKIC